MTSKSESLQIRSSIEQLNARVLHELDQHLESLYDCTYLDEEAIQREGSISIDPLGEIKNKAYKQAGQLIARNNHTEEIVRTNPIYREQIYRQEDQKGSAKVALGNCIDGRIPRAHTHGDVYDGQETMAGILPVRESYLGPRPIKRLVSATVEQSITNMADDPTSELLEIFFAHPECGAMQLLKQTRDREGNSFRSDDLVLENLELFKPQIEAITVAYNTAASAKEKRRLGKVAIRGVYDIETMGFIFGYGGSDQLHTADLAAEFEEELHWALKIRFPTFNHAPGVLRYSFIDRKMIVSQKVMLTNTIEVLMRSGLFQDRVSDALAKIPELSGLTLKQQRAFLFVIAKQTGFQYLTQLHKNKHEKGPHPFHSHREVAQAISVDDGFSVMPFQHEPQYQVFVASAANISQAIEHVKTQTELMEHYSFPEYVRKPFPLFIAGGMPEGAENNSEARKQARANIARLYRGVVEFDVGGANLVRKGIVVPVPIVVSSKSQKFIEIPNIGKI